MPNPPLLLVDSDALIQFFIAKQLLPLRELRNSYTVQTVVVPEVETELSWTPKFQNRFEPELRKAIGNGTIQVLDAATLAAYVPTNLVSATLMNILTLGADHYKYVGRGEAYTHAAAVVLNQPALSNDFNALQVLEANGLALPSPVLRVFDLLAFCYQAGLMSDGDCDQVRKELLKEREFIPKAFRSTSFINGLSNFCPRLLDGAKPAVGMPFAAGKPFATPMSVTHT